MRNEFDSPYLPKGRVADRFCYFKRFFAYVIWARLLRRYAGVDKASSAKFLEVGSGPGYFLRCLESWYPHAELSGLDSDKTLIDFSAKSLSRVKLFYGDGHALPFVDSSFDVVCALQVIEHLQNPRLFFGEAKRVLRAGGFLLIATPNPEGICAKVLGQEWDGYRFDHVSLKAPDDWRRIFDESGFRAIKDGTTGLTGFKALRVFPCSLLNYLPMIALGFFPWLGGESYMAFLQKR